MSNPLKVSAESTDWIGLQSLLREPLKQFFAPRIAACRAVAASGRKAVELNLAVDAAVRSFARDGGWPPLSEQERCLLGARLFWASCWITANIEESPFSMSGKSEEDVLEWLLIRGWQQGGAPFCGPIHERGFA